MPLCQQPVIGPQRGMCFFYAHCMILLASSLQVTTKQYPFAVNDGKHLHAWGHSVMGAWGHSVMGCLGTFSHGMLETFSYGMLGDIQ